MPIGKDKNFIFYISKCITNPEVSLCEYIKNSYFSNAKNITVSITNKIVVKDDGYGFPLNKKGEPDLINIINNVGTFRNSVKDKHLFGIGLLAFLSIGNKLSIKTRSLKENNKLSHTWGMTWYAKNLESSIPEIIDDFNGHGTEIIIENLYKTSHFNAQNFAFFVALDQPYIVSSKKAKIIIEDENKKIVVSPLRYRGKKINLTIRNKDKGNIKIGLYFDSDNKFPLSIRKSGETIYTDIKDMKYLNRYPWNSPYISGYIDYEGADISLWNGFLEGEKLDYFLGQMEIMEDKIIEMLKKIK
ncbi:MAG: ATP-binding protein [Thermoplasmata archaeon]